ncbi:MAG: hypothetical protein FWG16_08260 [Micrococcales bacterium]|nr:hypothetical protein [Micrococcales bacterium]
MSIPLPRRLTRFSALALALGLVITLGGCSSDPASSPGVGETANDGSSQTGPNGVATPPTSDDDPKTDGSKSSYQAPGPDLTGLGILAVLHTTSLNDLTIAAIDPAVPNKYQIVRQGFHCPAAECFTVYEGRIATTVWPSLPLTPLDHNYRYLAVQFEAGTGQHVGWVDEQGNLFDLTEAINADQPGVHQEAAGFHGTWFYYEDWENWSDWLRGGVEGQIAVRRVSLDNPSQVETVMSTEQHDPDWTVAPDGRAYYPGRWTMMCGNSGDVFAPIEADCLDASTFVSHPRNSQTVLVCPTVAQDLAAWTRYDSSLCTEPDFHSVDPNLDSSLVEWRYGPVASPDKTQIAYSGGAESLQDGPYVSGQPVFVVDLSSGQEERVYTRWADSDAEYLIRKVIDWR